MTKKVKTSNRRDFLAVAGAAGIAGFAGCTGGGGGNDTTTESEPTNGDTTTESEPTNVAIIYALGGKGDNSLSDASYRGLQMAKDEFDLNVQETEPSSAQEMGTLQRQFASSSDPNYDLIVTIGFNQAPGLKENADQFSDQRFAINDGVVKNKDNVVSYGYAANQGAYLAGMLSGHATTSDISAGAGSTVTDQKRIGFVGGMDVPVVNEHLAGFKAALQEVDPEIETRVGYVGSFSDPGKAKEIASSMYDKGVDIAYAGAGGSSVGVFRAAKDAGRYALGIDVDMSEAMPDFSDIIMASMVTGFRLGVYQAIKSVVNGNFKGGEMVTLGVDDGAGEVVYGTEIGSAIPSEAKDAVESSRQAIIDGEISVPNSLS